jgi:hypothetical protein
MLHGFFIILELDTTDAKALDCLARYSKILHFCASCTVNWSFSSFLLNSFINVLFSLKFTSLHFEPILKCPFSKIENWRIRRQRYALSELGFPDFVQQ